MDYEMIRISDRVVLFRWRMVVRQANHHTCQWIKDIKAALNGADKPIYFLSDLREGFVADVGTLRQVGKLTGHPNWGGGLSVGKGVAAEMYVGTFDRLSQQQHGDRQVRTLAEVKATLNGLAPGIADEIDWATALPELA